jgi:NAD(P)-dependent dehydrogenase (short-subunit alcohol dehydrogenase family)
MKLFASHIVAIVLAIMAAMCPGLSVSARAAPVDSQKATVVLVHGAFAESASWNGVIDKLQDQGYPVVAAANPLRSLEGKHNVRVRYSNADMSKASEIRDMADFARAEFGKVDTIVNNAGIQHVAPVRTVALEVAEHGVTCNTICPGFVKTPLVDKQIADQARTHGIPPERVVRGVLLVHQARKEFVRVEELAALAVFLASDDAASITGAAIAIDNRWTLH